MDLQYRARFPPLNQYLRLGENEALASLCDVSYSYSQSGGSSEVHYLQ